MVVDAVRDYIMLMDNKLTGIKEASGLYKSIKTTVINDQREVKVLDDIDHGIKHPKLLSIIDMLIRSTNHRVVAAKFILKDNELRGKVAKCRDTMEKLKKFWSHRFVISTAEHINNGQEFRMLDIVLESIDPSKQIAIIEHYLYILGHLEIIDPSICISWKLSSSALEMLVPGHAVGNVMGRGRANVDNIRKTSEASVEISDNKSSCGDRYDQDYFPGKRKRGKDYKEGMLRGTEVTLKGLKRKDVQLLRKFKIQFKGGFENAKVGGDTKIKPQTSIQMTSVTTVQGLNPHVNDVCSQQFRPRSSMSNDVCSQQFRPQTSMSNDVCSQQFRPRSSMSNDV
ncbi:auxin transport protein BIG [Tanacetum coccineum]